MSKTLEYNEMTDFELDEISSVDFPAQAPARAVLMKARDDDELMKRVRLTSVADGHQHLIAMKGEHGETSHDMAEGAEFGHSHPWVRNDDGSITIGLADGHTHTVIEKRLDAAEVLATLPGNHQEPAGSGGGPNGEKPMTKTDDKTAGADEAVEKRIQDAEARAEKAERLASLTDVQKAHYGTLSPDAQAEFLGASPEQRDAVVEKAAGDDPVVYTTLKGREIRKSAGDLVLELARDADENAKNLAVEKAARERESFAKRAKDELSNLPGNESAQIALLKAIDSIPSQADRDGALEIVKAANEGVSKAFETAGSVTGSEGNDAEGQLNELAQKRATANGVPFAKAYREVLDTPEGRELYKQAKA
jgi:hypothetical protein